MSTLPDPLKHRKADHPILDLFLKRWSPRAMTGEPLSDQELMTLFEAGRWAPSTYNEQEWRFLYAKNGSPQWATHFNLLVEGNQAWCKDAAVLVVVLSKKTFTQNGKPNPVHTFDSGAAFENIALQAAHMGLVCHGMMGFNQSKARNDLKVPEDYAVEAMFALGRPGDPNSLPDALKEREVPSDRKPLKEIVCEGAFGF
jgi:nitroreductase